MPFLDTDQDVLLAGAREIRRARSAADAERELAGGFRPRVVLLDIGANAPRGEALARRMASHPACAAVPIVGVSGDDERLRLTMLNGAGALSSASQLADLLRVIEDLGLDVTAPGADERELAF
jgi:CheY-like chemotaxis protein